ncbi:MAG: bifunctional DNA-formamidopyrimidine glycosylase/DNA-(apurinic or apyrimidinic site) lyase [Gemmatimonadota bacterium]
MPELPEVETIRRELAPELLGRRVEELRVRKPDIVLGPLSPAGLRRRLRGKRVQAVERRGKYLLLRFRTGDVLQVQLRMTGRFALGHHRPDPDEFRHIAAELELDDGRTLFYDDVRRLGGLRLLTADEWAGLEERIGPEPLSAEFTAARLGRILAGRRAPVKNLLLDQHRLAGVGNIYASEALHRAAIDPRRAAASLTRPEVRRLHVALRTVLREAVALAGTTFRNYRAVNGRSGAFRELLRVYGRPGADCARCGEAIRRIVQAGRSTFFCPGCQR